MLTGMIAISQGRTSITIFARPAIRRQMSQALQMTTMLQSKPLIETLNTQTMKLGNTSAFAVIVSLKVPTMIDVNSMEYLRVILSMLFIGFSLGVMVSSLFVK